MNRLLMPVIVVLMCGFGRQVSAQDQGNAEVETERAASREEPIRTGAQIFVDAYANRDANAIGQLFTEDADFLDETGTRSRGRAAIEARFQDAFDQSAEAVIESIDIVEIRFLGDDVAIEEGFVTASSGESSYRSRYAAIHHKEQDGIWRIAILKDFPPEEADRQSQLARLDWLIGNWINEERDSRVETSCEYSEDGNFLLRQFTVRMNDGRSMSGTQRVGWDPVHKKLRSWTFDSEGGLFDGFWTQVADGWLVTTAGVNGAGESVTATAKYEIIDAEMVQWHYTSLIIGDNVADSSPEVTMVRRPPEPQLSATEPN